MILLAAHRASPSGRHIFFYISLLRSLAMVRLGYARRMLQFLGNRNIQFKILCIFLTFVYTNNINFYRALHAYAYRARYYFNNSVRLSV